MSQLKDKGTNKFSKAFLETTAVIAYKQPVTRGDIEDAEASPLIQIIFGPY